MQFERAHTKNSWRKRMYSYALFRSGIEAIARGQ